MTPPLCHRCRGWAIVKVDVGLLHHWYCLSCWYRRRFSTLPVDAA